MARPLRVEYPGAIYHVTVRRLGGWKTERTRLFEDDADRQRLLDRLADRVVRFEIRLYLYCFLGNHIHLVFETPQANASAFMQSLQTAYTVYFNLRHKRHGHLVDGRFKAKLVEGDDYLLALTRYVHLNPVCVGRIKAAPIRERIRLLRQHRWSSYPSYVGLVKPLDFVAYAPLLALIGGKGAEAWRRYRRYVEAGLANDDESFRETLTASRHCIGGAAFRAWVDEQYRGLADRHPRREDVALRRMRTPLGADTILAVLAETLGTTVEAFRRRRRRSPLRGVAARLLTRYGGLTQRAAAAVLGMGTGAAVSAQMRKMEAWLQRDRRLRAKVEQAANRLEALRAPPDGGPQGGKA